MLKDRDRRISYDCVIKQSLFSPVHLDNYRGLLGATISRAPRMMGPPIQSPYHSTITPYTASLHPQQQFKSHTINTQLIEKVLRTTLLLTLKKKATYPQVYPKQSCSSPQPCAPLCVFYGRGDHIGLRALPGKAEQKPGTLKSLISVEDGQKLLAPFCLFSPSPLRTPCSLLSHSSACPATAQHSSIINCLSPDFQAKPITDGLPANGSVCSSQLAVCVFAASRDNGKNQVKPPKFTHAQADTMWSPPVQQHCRSDTGSLSHQPARGKEDECEQGFVSPQHHAAGILKPFLCTMCV